MENCGRRETRQISSQKDAHEGGAYALGGEQKRGYMFFT